ncbi:hypothetical protein BH11PSE11_BH11PSE11_12380 [soil metagenome]
MSAPATAEVEDAKLVISDVLMHLRGLHWASLAAESHDDLDHLQALVTQSIPSIFLKLERANVDLGGLRNGYFDRERL